MERRNQNVDWFDGYLDTPLKFVTGTGLIVTSATLLFIFSGIADEFVAFYFVTVAAVFLICGLYISRNTLYDMFVEALQALVLHLETYPQFPWMSRKASNALAAILAFVVIIIFPFACKLENHAGTILKLTCLALTVCISLIIIKNNAIQ